MPFGVNSYTDVVIVLRQVFNTNIFYDRDILDSIVFKYHFESNDTFKRDLFITNIYIYLSFALITIILLFCTYILYVQIYSVYRIEFIDEEILNYAYETIQEYNNKELNKVSAKPFIFSPFVELLNGHVYIPSKFTSIYNNYFYVIDYLNVTDNIPDPILSNSTNTMLELSRRLAEYELLVSDLIVMINRGP